MVPVGSSNWLKQLAAVVEDFVAEAVAVAAVAAAAAAAAGAEETSALARWVSNRWLIAVDRYVTSPALQEVPLARCASMGKSIASTWSSMGN